MKRMYSAKEKLLDLKPDIRFALEYVSSYSIRIEVVWQRLHIPSLIGIINYFSLQYLRWTDF